MTIYKIIYVIMLKKKLYIITYSCDMLKLEKENPFE